MLQKPLCFSDTLTTCESKRATYDGDSDSICLHPDEQVDFTRHHDGVTYAPTSICGVDISTGKPVFWFEAM